MDWLERKVIGLQSGASGHPYNKVLSSFEGHIVACFAQRRLDRESTRGGINRNIHKHVESSWNLIRFDSKRSQGFCQIAKTSSVRIGVTVNNPKGVLRARCQQKVVPTDRVFHDPQQHLAPV